MDDPNHSQRRLFQPDDTQAMTEAVKWCRAQKIYVERRGGQLKVLKLNFWPSTGTLTLDGGYTFPQKGFEAFKQHALNLWSNRKREGQFATEPSKHRETPPAADTDTYLRLIHTRKERGSS
jgi:hypothetical protein